MMTRKFEMESLAVVLDGCIRGFCHFLVRWVIEDGQAKS